MMNILVAANNQYIKPLRVLLASLFQHEAGKLDIYLLHSGVSKENLTLLDLDIKKMGGRFWPIPVDEAIFQDAPLLHHFTNEVYYRVLCGEVLPETMERVLYLDADMLVRGSLKDFYNMEFQGKTLIGITDTLGPVYYRNRHYVRLAALGLTEEDVYVNSGVLLFNLEKMRKSFVLQDFLRQLNEKREILDMVDQDMINVYFKGEIGVVDEMYNYPAIVFSASFLINWIAGGWRRDNPKIVHYMGNPKPWHPNYFGKYYFEYQRYYRRLQSRGEQIGFAWKHVFGYIWEVSKGICRVLIRNGARICRKIFS